MRHLADKFNTTINLNPLKNSAFSICVSNKKYIIFNFFNDLFINLVMNPSKGSNKNLVNNNNLSSNFDVM